MNIYDFNVMPLSRKSLDEYYDVNTSSSKSPDEYSRFQLQCCNGINYDFNAMPSSKKPSVENIHVFNAMLSSNKLSDKYS